MSSISALQNVGLDATSPAKPVTEATPPAATDVTTASQSVAAAASTYPNPVFSIDASSSRVIFEYRDPQTGVVTEQLPSKDAIRLYQEAAAPPASPPKADRAL